MPEVNIQELQTEVAVLKTKLEGLEQGRFAALEAKIEAVGEGVGANRALLEVQSQRIDRLETGLMSFRGEVRDDLKGVRNWLTGVLVIVGGVIGVIQYLTQ